MQTNSAQHKKNLMLIACGVMQSEFEYVIGNSPHHIRAEYLSMGIHDQGGRKMSNYLSGILDTIDEASFDAIILGYALCNNGIAGLRARSIPIVTPRAHDCITLFLGSKDRYAEYFRSNPGVYYQTQGWAEQSNIEQAGPQFSIHSVEMTRDYLIGKYGEDNGNYLFEELQKQNKKYSQYTFIEMGIENGEIESKIRRRANERNWKFEKVQGSLSLFRRLVYGEWNDEDFLIVPPGYRIIPTYDDMIIGIEPCPDE